MNKLPHLLLSIILITVIVAFAVSLATAQVRHDASAEIETEPTTPAASTKEPEVPAAVPVKDNPLVDDKRAERKTRPSAKHDWYVRPSATERRRQYIRSVVGPVALIRYSSSAGILTARNAPSEWGGGWDGFGRRFASEFGESAIDNTVRYSLSELLKLDDRFYLSRDRSPVARARNAVFSAVTSRNRRGERVFATPKITGHVVSGVIAAEVWYPSRYDYKHGLKGAAISVAVDAGVNLFREFVWKR